MATLIEWLRNRLAFLRRQETADNLWVEPGNAITRSVLSGSKIEIPEVQPSPLTPVTAEALDLAAFEEAPIPPLGVEPPLIQPQVAPAWEAVDQPVAAPETPKPRVAEQAEGAAAAEEKPAEPRRKRRWWRAA